MKRLVVSAAVMAISFGICAQGAIAQEGGASPEMDAALAAGWKAAFTCSASFNGGLPLSTIEQNELDGIYPDFRDSYGKLPPAQINRTQKTVAVSWSQTLPPRYAVWRTGHGCTQLPIGADLTFAATLPRFTSFPDMSASDNSTAIGSDVRLRANEGTYSAVDAPVTFAFDGNTYGVGTRTSAVVILSGGEVIAERYARGISATTAQRTWSVAKSFSASIIGAASYAGLFDYKGRTALEAWETPGDPRQKITTEHLLQMASGLDSGARGNRTDRLYFGGGRVIDHATGNPLEAEPGTRFKYANNDTLLAMRTLRERLNNDDLYKRLPYEQLLWKIGAEHTTLETDWNGDLLSSSQIWTTARDMARLGQLYLQDGVWGEERILPEGWAEFVSTPAPAQPADRDGFGYGAQFWLLDNVGGVPRDTYAALGNRGQSIVIVPSRDIVIVRRGYDANGGGRFDIGAFTRDVLAAIEVSKRALEAQQARTSALENGELEPTE